MMDAVDAAAGDEEDVQVVASDTDKTVPSNPAQD
jgi:hypothetical protein